MYKRGGRGGVSMTHPGPSRPKRRKVNWEKEKDERLLVGNDIWLTPMGRKEQGPEGREKGDANLCEHPL